MDRGPRFIWRLFSPSFRLITCALARHDDGFELRVTCDGDVLTSARARDLESLHARAAEWRQQLEGHGYVPADTARFSEPRPSVRSGETRTAFKGLVECAALLELQHRETGRRLRDRATEALVAVGLSDPDFIKTAIEQCRAVLADAMTTGANADLMSSCQALIERASSGVSEISRGGGMIGNFAAPS